MNDFAEKHTLLHINDVADILDISPYTVRKLIKNKRLLAVKAGKQYLITEHNLLLFLNGESTQVNSRKEA